MAEINFQVTTDLSRYADAAIDANFDEVSAQLNELMAPYSAMVVTEDAISGAKSDLARIRRVKSAIDDYRKSVKKTYSAPLVAFESKCKALTAICEQGESNLSKQITAYDERRKAEKRKALETFFDELVDGELRPYISFAGIENPRWQNVTFSLDAAQEEIRAAVATCMDGVDAIRKMHSPFETELLSEFARSHDLTACIRRDSELKEIQKREQERREAEEMRRRAAEEVRRIADEAVPVPKLMTEETQPEPTEADPVYTLDLRVWATKVQLRALRNACNLLKIKVKRIQ